MQNMILHPQGKINTQAKEQKFKRNSLSENFSFQISTGKIRRQTSDRKFRSIYAILFFFQEQGADAGRQYMKYTAKELDKTACMQYT